MASAAYSGVAASCPVHA